MKPLRLPALAEAQCTELDQLHLTAKYPRPRTRAQIVLLAGEQQLTVPEIVPILREAETTVMRWLKRYQAEGVEVLKDAPAQGDRPMSPRPIALNCSPRCGVDHAAWSVVDLTASQ